MKCNKCGYDWSNSGDSAHVCGPVKVKQQEQGEPVAWRVNPRYEDSDGFFDFTDSNETAKELESRGWSTTPLYTAPPKRPWVGLTDDEIALIHADYPHPQGFAKAIEAKLKEKNNGT